MYIKHEIILEKPLQELFIHEQKNINYYLSNLLPVLLYWRKLTSPIL